MMVVKLNNRGKNHLGRRRDNNVVTTICGCKATYPDDVFFARAYVTCKRCLAAIKRVESYEDE